ncbi:MAG: glutamine-hydrolyzing carbamoyl-phosphate synthase small subunit [Pseudomonadota bacterium]
MTPAILALEDGTVFEGISIGADVKSIGEVVFNTAMTGYQEILTDPSYCRQIVTLTYPHIGNTGTNSLDFEAREIFAAGLVVRDRSIITSNYRNEQNLSDFLRRGNIPAIAEIDTRKLTRILRERGAQSGCIVVGEAAAADAIKASKRFPGLAGMDLARVVTTKERYQWALGTEWPDGTGPVTRHVAQFHVVAYDFGVKRNILRLLCDQDCRVTVVPATTSADEVLELEPDGVFLSNGPGDPDPCSYAIEATQALLERGLPVFGICLGHQILGLALGAKTKKMKFGHHGANHPVRDEESGRVFITSQNHGFEIDADTLPDDVAVTHRSLFDQSVQGIRSARYRAFGFQGHPEASPGPHDIRGLFGRFTEMMAETQASADATSAGASTS